MSSENPCRLFGIMLWHLSRVWFAVDEVPSWQTVVGGGIVMTGVVAQILVGHGTDRLTFVDDVKAGTG